MMTCHCSAALGSCVFLSYTLRHPMPFWVCIVNVDYNTHVFPGCSILFDNILADFVMLLTRYFILHL